ncbi:MAG: GNAT family N-acetyltransferase [Candidatus Poribacteria bacterium]|nr:GNAT family N-acetyltransferase [Candidatus Poribacteria bacterium]
MNDEHDFEFLDPGRLVDGDLALILVQKRPAQPARGYVPAYRFEMRPVGKNRNMGNISLRVGDNENLEKYVGHIGYSVAPVYRGHRYAARSCQLILPLARRHGINPLWITCNPNNIASRRTCEIVGATFIEIVALPTDHPLYMSGERAKCRYRIDLA